ncbi:MFS transporter [Streptomyces sp. UNOC14_S4]|uniref:MFS transporter n=1 Tax=Streptomyces sp. UNOC14_S4 TaxID=2872340 RepID=UPI001E49C47B|nr:MFS transporter [Streptomyces sp. UNOC14_S4]MCC3767968.1 MFS transporter [Streptomyces sp. UNOC14_S4]
MTAHPATARLPAAGAARQPGRAVSLFAVLLALLILPTAVTGSGVALPHIGRDTGASLDALQWVMHSYNLTFASLLLACGSLADLAGRRRVFTAGGMLFTAASLASALATDVVVLDVMRGAAGVGAAALLTGGSSLLAATFDGAARTRVFAAVGIVTGGGLALGAMAAGALADALGWRSFFGLHAALMLLVLCAVPFLPESRGDTAARVDRAGTTVLIGGLFLLMLGTVEGPQWGWGSAGVLGLLAGSVLLMVVFVVVERRVRHPMLDLGLLRNAGFMALCLIPVVVSFSFVVLLPLLPGYLVVANGSSSRAAGATMLLMTLPVLVTPLAAGRLIRWGVPTQGVLGLSLVCLTAGVAWLAAALRPGAGPAELAGPLLVLGAGLGLNFGLVDGAVLTVVPPEATGTAAGLLNTLRLGSEAVVIAAAGAGLTGLTRDRLSGGPDRFPAYDGTAADLANEANAGDLDGSLSALPPGVRREFADFVAHGLTGAWHAVLWTSAAVCAALSVTIVAMLPRRRATTGTADADAP